MVDRMIINRRKANRCSPLMMHFMDVLVQEGRVYHSVKTNIATFQLRNYTYQK